MWNLVCAYFGVHVRVTYAASTDPGCERCADEDVCSVTTEDRYQFVVCKGPTAGLRGQGTRLDA